MTARVITARFEKSTYSGSINNGDCVEVARTADGGRAVRDSKDPARGTQYHSPAAWSAFLRTVKSEPAGD